VINHTMKSPMPPSRRQPRQPNERTRASKDLVWLGRKVGINIDGSLGINGTCRSRFQASGAPSTTR
jgi:hypothetical protein